MYLILVLLLKWNTHIFREHLAKTNSPSNWRRASIFCEFNFQNNSFVYEQQCHVPDIWYPCISRIKYGNKTWSTIWYDGGDVVATLGHVLICWATFWYAGPRFDSLTHILICWPTFWYADQRFDTLTHVLIHWPTIWYTDPRFDTLTHFNTLFI